MLCNMKNRRSCNDRRHVRYKVSFPLRTNDNITVSNDRRFRCDRRMQGLEVTESDVSKEAFEEYFSVLRSECGHSNINIESTPSSNIQNNDIYNSFFNHEK